MIPSRHGQSSDPAPRSTHAPILLPPGCGIARPSLPPGFRTARHSGYRNHLCSLGRVCTVLVLVLCSSDCTRSCTTRDTSQRGCTPPRSTSTDPMAHVPDADARTAGQIPVVGRAAVAVRFAGQIPVVRRAAAVIGFTADCCRLLLCCRPCTGRANAGPCASRADVWIVCSCNSAAPMAMSVCRLGCHAVCHHSLLICNGERLRLLALDAPVIRA